MEKVYKILIAVIAFCFVQKVESMTEEQVKAEFVKMAMKCMNDHPIPLPELMALQKYIAPKETETKCLLACVYRMAKTMNEQGMYDLEQSYKIAEKVADGDQNRLENGKKLVDICAKETNDAKVSDGEKGCERAAIIFKCTAENAPKLGFKLV